KVLIAPRASDCVASHARNFWKIGLPACQGQQPVGCRANSKRQKIDLLAIRKPKLIAKDPATAQAPRNYRNTKLFSPFSPALLVLKIRHFISNHSAHVLLASTGLCRDSICDFCGITSTVGRTRLGATASSWDQLKPWRR